MSLRGATCARWLLLGLLLGCPQPEAAPLIVKNVCLLDADCEPEARCDLIRQQCYRERPDHPYLVLLQVYPQPDEFALVAQYNSSFRLTESSEDSTIAVPETVTVSSRVEDNNGKAIEAEVTFTPSEQDVALPSTPIVVTAREKDGAEGKSNLSARLTPGASYDVRVQPLVQASAELPPMMTMYQSSMPLLLSYDTMTRLQGKLVNENGKEVSAHRVRLEHPESGAVLSSTTETNDKGEFSLFADPNSDSWPAASEAAIRLAVSIPSFPPFRVTVALDGSQLKPDTIATVIMPTVPEAVTYGGNVKSPSTRVVPYADRVVPYADLQLVSSFPYIMSNTSNTMGDVDWCQFRDPKNAGLKVSCSARVATTAGATGAYELNLLPGIYQVFATPGSEVARNQQLATSSSTLRVETPGGGGVVVQVAEAGRYRGQINSYDGRALPNVSVTARALAYPGVVGELGRYNRTVTTLTDGSGRFDLALDQGYFDLVIEPPAESGFAWSGSLNRIFDVNETGGALRPMTAASPVYVSGQVQQAGSKRPLTGARIEAYALVSSLSGGQRSVRIGQASSDAEGNYRLALPATIGEELCAKGSTAKCDCGNGVSGDRECSVAGTFNTCDCPPVTDSGRRAR